MLFGNGHDAGITLARTRGATQGEIESVFRHMSADPFPDDLLPNSEPRAHAVRLYGQILRQNPDCDREIVIAVMTYWLKTHAQLAEVRALVERIDRLAVNLGRDSAELARNNKDCTSAILAAALRRN